MERRELERMARALRVGNLGRVDRHRVADMLVQTRGEQDQRELVDTALKGLAEIKRERDALAKQVRELKKVGDAHNAAFGFGGDAIALEGRVRWMAQHIHDLRKAGQWLRDCFCERPTLCKQEMLDRWDELTKSRKA